MGDTSGDDGDPGDAKNQTFLLSNFFFYYKKVWFSASPSPPASPATSLYLSLLIIFLCLHFLEL